jgi:hypothetical protein
MDCKCCHEIATEQSIIRFDPTTLHHIESKQGLDVSSSHEQGRSIYSFAQDNFAGWLSIVDKEAFWIVSVP